MIIINILSNFSEIVSTEIKHNLIKYYLIYLKIKKKDILNYILVLLMRTFLRCMRNRKERNILFIILFLVLLPVFVLSILHYFPYACSDDTDCYGHCTSETFGSCFFNGGACHYCSHGIFGRNCYTEEGCEKTWTIAPFIILCIIEGSLAIYFIF